MIPEDVGTFRERLTAWFDEKRRPLPWRKTLDPYAIWVSEVMLQQTQVQAVIDYYHRFLERFPNVGALCAAELESVLKVWEGLGYYGRARNLHRAARIVTERHEGRVPDTFEDFIALPGVGDYIASAVMSIAFGKAHAVVDGNVKRVLSRLFKEPSPVNRPASHWRFKQVAEGLLDPARPGHFNQAMMELGALVCRPARPLCDGCPVACACLARADGRQAEFPKREKRPKIPTRQVVVGVIHRKGRLLITRRKPEGLLGGLWEFPGGKIERGEADQSALCREIREEVGLEVAVEAPLARVRHAYTHFKVEMAVYRCRYVSGRVILNGPVDHRWVLPEELGQYPFPGANRKFMHFLTDPSSAFFMESNKEIS